ncbi:hypothetical protein AGABI2DRAFT_121922 [Agaricus bisporus var. bisporus H97]|uniref:hypothetical protein n=1 Tax=Agaricus bisporus var. bisporus (strain H97 / ATCC MYA-4626 / FGSC 10389) TaxID=936046 RepID=UPI00029F5118|nr:hypothetical protein AGABI2DRAFT_121922 [Agaricus bisporus var. bisporus H97]EKV43029.1 hypothetical protein AGABI2DRAFT_121922 [Agaricus bisporus var. bisporus H97]
MNSAIPILPVYNTTQLDGKNALPSCPVLDSVSIVFEESSCNQSKLASPQTTVEGLLGLIRQSPLVSQKISIRTCASFEENATISDPPGGLETSGEYLCQAYTSSSVGSIYPQRQTPQWPSIPHEAVHVPVIMPVKKLVQDVSLMGTDLLHRKSLTDCDIKIDQDFYPCHLPIKPAPIVPRRITCAQPEFIHASFNALANSPLLLPTAFDFKRAHLQDFPSSMVNTLNDVHHSILPISVTTHTHQPWIPSFGHWVNSRLAGVLTSAPLGMLSNSESMEEFLARFSNPEGLHKPWHQILDDLEYDMDPFRAV